MGLARPVYLTHAGDGSGRLFVVEKPGRIRIIANGDLLAAPFLDILGKVDSSGNEQGLLSVAFHPDFSNNRRFFVYYTSNASDEIIVAEYKASAANPNVAEASERVLLRVPHPTFENHNGGLLKFGPDGYLYIGIGDGGGAGDPGPPPGNGQNTNVLLGKILRIDVDSGNPYGIPADNPFASGANGKREIYAYGFRNPWRYSFDRETGKLWCGDVGQNRYEEVDVVTRGGNFGWNVMEGFHCYNPSSGCNTAGLVQPIYEYDHGGSNGVPPGACSITGGYVYRGTRIPSLVGVYVFADYCLGSAALYGIREGDSMATPLPTDVESEPITSFGEDEEGELYVVTDSSFGGRGGIYRIVRPAGSCDLGCSPDVTVEDVDGDGSEVVTYDAPTMGGDCGTVACDPPSGSSFAVGTTTVTCTSSAGDGQCSFAVTVEGEGGLSVRSVDPPSSPRKTTLTVQILGSGFDPAARVSFGKKIKVKSTTVVSPTRIDATIKVKKAKRGPRDVTVTNPGGVEATCAGCFTVE